MGHTLFLDFDGVMHPIGSCVWDREKQQMRSVDAFRWWPILQAAIDACPVPVNIVIHSTWRLLWETDAELFALLPKSMLPYVLGTTDRTIMSRERSILEYITKNKIAHFLVLDDEPGAFALGYEPLIACHSAKGLSQPGVIAALNERLAEWSLLECSHAAP